MLGYVLSTALFVFMAVRAMRRGFRPGTSDSKTWYDRIINAAGGILLLAFWVFMLVAHFFGPQPHK